MSTKLSEIERKHTLVLIVPRAFYTELQLSLIDLVDLPDDTNLSAICPILAGALAYFMSDYRVCHCRYI